jgi:hypothetical protein
MRFFYFLLYITLKYALRIFFPRQKVINGPKAFFGRTIYVSNHAASFMDPLIVASLRRPIVFFMTRSDVFTTFTKPFLWAAHMLPIYRQLDGGDTKEQNAKVFEKCSKILSFGRNLLIFGEGFTDDVFVRRLKPVKKGAIRIGFTALENMNWKKKVYVAAVGCNYSDPNRLGSDILVSTSEKFCLNDYKEQYIENPNKTITDLTRKLELMMQEQITHVNDLKWASFHENVMRITRKGMNAEDSDTAIPLEKRWKYSKKLANWLNGLNQDELEKLEPLKKDLEGYFSLLKKMRIREKLLFEFNDKGKFSKVQEILTMVFLFPFAILGLIHAGVPYILIKRFVEKKFRRKVFWGSVKLLLGKIVIGLVNIPVIFAFYHWVYPSYWMALLYYSLIGLFGLAAYKWFKAFSSYKEKTALSKVDLSKFLMRRKKLIEDIHIHIPEA